jgi:hypothetical protein
LQQNLPQGEVRVVPNLPIHRGQPRDMLPSHFRSARVDHGSP